MNQPDLTGASVMYLDAERKPVATAAEATWVRIVWPNGNTLTGRAVDKDNAKPVAPAPAAEPVAEEKTP